MLHEIIDFKGDAISIKQMTSLLSKDDGIRFKNKEDTVQHYADIIVDATNNDQISKTGFIRSLKEYFESEILKSSFETFVAKKACFRLTIVLISNRITYCFHQYINRLLCVSFRRIPPLSY